MRHFIFPSKALGGALVVILAALCDAQQAQLEIQLGHSDAVSSVAFSPDGQFVLTGGWDEKAVLWELATGREIRHFTGHSGWVTSVAFSPDSSSILTGSLDGTARLWNIATGREIRRFEGRTGDVNSAAFSPDGRRVLTGGGYSMAHLWETSSPNELRRYAREPLSLLNIYSVAFSPDGRSAAVGGQDGAVRLWDLASGALIRSFEGHTGWVKSVAFSPDGRLLLSGSEDQTARLWDLASANPIWLFRGHTKAVSAVAFSPDGRSILTGSEDATARLWETASGREIRGFDGGGLYVQSVAFSPDGRLALTGNLDGTARLWEVDSGREIRRFEGRVPGVGSLAFSRDSRFVVMACGTEARLWDFAKGREVQRFKGHSGAVSSVAFSPDGLAVLTGSLDKTARLWDVATGREKLRFEGHAEYVNSVAFAPNGQFVLTGSDDQTVRLWNAANGSEVRRFERDVGYVKAVAFAPDGKSIVTAGKTAQLWDVATGREIRRFEGHSDSIPSVAFSPDGQMVLTGSWDSTARLWDVASGREIHQLKEPGLVSSVAFSPDGQSALVVEDNVAVLWDVTKREEISLLDGGSDVTFAAFAPSNQWAMTASSFGAVRLWRLGTGLMAGTLAATLSSFRDGGWVVAAPDGRFDTSELDGTAPVHWIVDDQPLRPLPLAIFIRDYYEPRLLPRFLSRERVPDVRELQNLNRVQPETKILAVERGERADEVRVRLEVARGEGRVQRDGKASTIQTDAYDLRLFRGGQLVGQVPEPKDGVEESLTNGATLKPEQLQAWREARRVKADPATGKAEITFRVRLPHGQAGKKIEFTAYAFNEDRVKSETATTEYIVPQDVGPLKKRAYVITIGINGYQNPRRNLEFAVKDATDIASALHEIKDYEVVPVALLSEDPLTVPQPVNHATKARIRAVLGALAGSTDRSGLTEVKNADELAKATPDDLVILSFSGHGHAISDGAFYLLPSDSGTEDAVTEASLKTFISSRELSDWLRDVDAGEMAMIIDACHSAASVEAEGFKPGPMGDQGLGQLAYDKGMRILAASQSDDVALEFRNLRQGLLTYALVLEGLGQGGGTMKADLDGDGAVTLEEWLKYGEQRTPTLYEDAKAGKVQVVSRGVKLNPARLDDAAKHAQTPALFDFNKRHENVVIGPR